MPEFSRRVDVFIFKAEPVPFNEFVPTDRVQTAAGKELAYRQYLTRFQPYSWHAKAANHEITCHGEAYFNEADAINAVELLFGDDTTAYRMPMYGDDRGMNLLRYGKTDRDHQQQS